MDKHPSYKPPRLATWLLLWFLKEEIKEEVLGDLEEKFQLNLYINGPFKAKLNYWYQVLHYFRPFAIKNYRSNSNFFTMLQHNTKLTYRSFIRYKSSFIINLIGLTCGLTCSLLIYLFMGN